MLSTHGNQTPGSQPGTIYKCICVYCISISLSLARSLLSSLSLKRETERDLLSMHGNQTPGSQPGKFICIYLCIYVISICTSLSLSLSTHGNNTPGSQPGKIYYILYLYICILYKYVYIYIYIYIYKLIIYIWWSCSSCSPPMGIRRREASQVRSTIYYVLYVCVYMYI